MINQDFKAISFGQNESGQCGQDVPIPLTKPTLINHLKNLNIIQIGCGKGHSLFLTENNEVYACGNNERGQLGIGSRLKWCKKLPKPKKIVYDGPPVKKIGCGNEFSALLDTDGHLYMFGMSEFGQLGYNPNTDCVYSARKVSFNAIADIRIVDFSCGSHHTVFF